MAKTVVAIFKDRQNAQDAINDMEDMGIQPKDISIVLRDTSVAHDMATDTGANVAGGAVSGATTGGVIGALAGLLVANGVLPGLGTILIGGPLATALGLTGAAATVVSGAATGALAGTLVGALMGFGLTEKEAREYEEELKAGAIFVAVPTPDSLQGSVYETLTDYGATQIKTLDVPTDEIVEENLTETRDDEVTFHDTPPRRGRYVHSGMKGGATRTRRRR